jgi:hypothetical protein
MYALLMDPAVAWQEQAGPFADGGDPSLGLLVSAARLGIPMAPFPFTAAGYVIHRGRGSFAAVHAAGDRSHLFYEWAEDHHAPHFAGVPGADQRYRALLQEFRNETGPLTETTLAAACHRAPGHQQHASTTGTAPTKPAPARDDTERRRAHGGTGVPGAREIQLQAARGPG